MKKPIANKRKTDKLPDETDEEMEEEDDGKSKKRWN